MMRRTNGLTSRRSPSSTPRKPSSAALAPSPSRRSDSSASRQRWASLRAAGTSSGRSMVADAPAVTGAGSLAWVVQRDQQHDRALALRGKAPELAGQERRSGHEA